MYRGQIAEKHHFSTGCRPESDCLPLLLPVNQVNRPHWQKPS
jgi:hypothetical protein